MWLQIPMGWCSQEWTAPRTAASAATSLFTLILLLFIYSFCIYSNMWLQIPVGWCSQGRTAPPTAASAATSLFTIILLLFIFKFSYIFTCDCRYEWVDAVKEGQLLIQRYPPGGHLQPHLPWSPHSHCPGAETHPQVPALPNLLGELLTHNHG